MPVVDLGALLADSAPPGPTRFVALRLDDRRVALAVEAVLGLRELPAEAMGQLPPLLRSAGEAAVAALGTLDAELLVALEATRLVPESVWPALPRGSAR